MKPDKDVYSAVLLQEIDRLQAEVKLQEIVSDKLKQEIKDLKRTIAQYRMHLIGRHPYERT